MKYLHEKIYSKIVCNNCIERNYVLSWAIEQGKDVAKCLYELPYPLYLVVSDNIVGWTDCDRIGLYINFNDWIADIYK